MLELAEKFKLRVRIRNLPAEAEMKKQSSIPAVAAAAIVVFITFSCKEQQMLSIVQAHFLLMQFNCVSSQSLVVMCGFVKEVLQVALPVFIRTRL